MQLLMTYAHKSSLDVHVPEHVKNLKLHNILNRNKIKIKFTFSFSNIYFSIMLKISGADCTFNTFDVIYIVLTS